jgi:hypothetical protein
MSDKIKVVGANLYKLAAQYYGDPMGWVQIAQANGLNDPFIDKPMTLIIPSWNGSKSGVWNG